ncbi:MAG: DsbA family protein [Patescibacteria group bacterium]|jgi:protein-disulfide isomerase|nr:DsbA family protein [Patescibacteria group bacterium]
MKNNKGYSIVVLLVVFALIGLAYAYSFREDKVAVENILGDTGLIDDSESENPYMQAIDAAKRVQQLQMRPISEDDNYIGNLDAPVKIIYYSDFECPFCNTYVSDLKRISEEYADNVVFAFRHFILSNHSLALDAAFAFECAVEQGSTWGMYDKLYEDSANKLQSRLEYIKDAEELELNVEQFTECLESEKYKNKIEKLVQEAKSYGVTGTPTTFINGKPLAGAYPYDDFVDQLGKEKKGLKTIVEEGLRR